MSTARTPSPLDTPGHWLHSPLVALDTETTHVDPHEAWMVSFALVLMLPDGELAGQEAWRVDPGVPIPEEASAVHGLTADRLTHALPHAKAVLRLVEHLHYLQDAEMPVVVFNAPFDLTLLHAHATRLGLEWPDDLMVLDPLVIDRAMNPLRKGKRTLGALCALAHINLEGAHTADADATATAQLMHWQVQRYPKLQQASLRQLQVAQARAHGRWAARLAKAYRTKGKVVQVNPHWPLNRSKQ